MPLNMEQKKKNVCIAITEHIALILVFGIKFQRKQPTKKKITIRIRIKNNGNP